MKKKKFFNFLDNFICQKQPIPCCRLCRGLLDWNSCFIKPLHYALLSLFVSNNFQHSSFHNIVTNLKIFSFLQLERYVDRKIDKAEDILKSKQRKARSWYHSFINNGDGDGYELQELHIFIASFAAGLAFGFATA